MVHSTGKPVGFPAESIMTGRQILHQISNELKSENRIWNIKFMEKDLNGKMIHFGDYRFDSETETIEKMGQTDFVFEKDNIIDVDKDMLTKTIIMTAAFPYALE